MLNVDILLTEYFATWFCEHFPVPPENPILYKYLIIMMGATVLILGVSCFCLC